MKKISQINEDMSTMFDRMTTDRKPKEKELSKYIKDWLLKSKPEFIDLGLKSGNLWCNMNFLDSKPNEYTLLDINEYDKLLQALEGSEFEVPTLDDFKELKHIEFHINSNDNDEDIYTFGVDDKKISFIAKGEYTTKHNLVNDSDKICLRFKSKDYKYSIIRIHGYKYRVVDPLILSYDATNDKEKYKKYKVPVRLIKRTQ